MTALPEIRVRRISFDFPSLDDAPPPTRRHFVEGDLVMSHIVAMLSAVFPEGEDFFVRSVRHFKDEITDPKLKRDVAGFIGQEVTHGREHRELNDQLQAMGYPTHAVDRFVKWLLAQEWICGPKFHLAVTAALEHYTATLAETLLTKPQCRALLGDTEVRSALLWHALEESEHKAVAFDVFRAVGGSERLRIRTMRITSFQFLVLMSAFTLLSLSRDRAAYNPIRLVRSLARLPRSPFFARDVRRTLRGSNRPGFHPEDNDATELLAYWREELFGESGALTDHLR